MRLPLIAAGVAVLAASGCVVHHHPRDTAVAYRTVEYRYGGVHPIPSAWGDGWCFIEHHHVHDYEPDQSFYTYRTGVYYYARPMVIWYVGYHPVPTGGHCNVYGRHSHRYHPGSSWADHYAWDSRDRAYAYRQHPAAPVNNGRPPPGQGTYYRPGDHDATPPPGHGGVPPGHGGVPPGQGHGSTPPGHVNNPSHGGGGGPAHGGVPPGHVNNPGRGGGAPPPGIDDRGRGGNSYGGGLPPGQANNPGRGGGAPPPGNDDRGRGGGPGPDHGRGNSVDPGGDHGRGNARGQGAPAVVPAGGSGPARAAPPPKAKGGRGNDRGGGDRGKSDESKRDSGPAQGNPQGRPRPPPPGRAR